MGQRVLITGGAGFVGSHTCLVLLEQGHELAGSSQLTLVEGDVRDPSAVKRDFSSAGAVDGVNHFAGLKAFRELVANPLFS